MWLPLMPESRRRLPFVPGLLAEYEVHQIQPHPQRGLALVGGIVVDLFVLEPVAQVAVVRIEYNQPSVVDNSEGAGRASVVLVDLGEPAGKFVKLVKNRGGKGQLDHRI